MERAEGKNTSPDAMRFGLVSVLLSPSQVYRGLREQGALHRLLWGFSGAVLLNGLMTGMAAPDGGRGLLGALAVVNALGMALLTACAGWLALGVVKGGLPPLAVAVPCVAYGFGVTLLVSWIPGSFWFTEPWKWAVIGTGFRDLGGLSGRRAFGGVLLMVSALVVLFKGIFMMQGA
ncbi:hypothetical protein DSLASN_41710 [Desulfoluna limicola]|uniref:Yip1 domain-containing protein n=1 Tax=Desulfoluna limicola TaxID=2810562 RepID=A0ABM7PMW5_9BACT|nr:hypothetical protein [Desulfoluna limicola]BCS98539.1 hypothetical protein DSLASN_41710 [Desulfoluna limicola]